MPTKNKRPAARLHHDELRDIEARLEAAVWKVRELRFHRYTDSDFECELGNLSRQLLDAQNEALTLAEKSFTGRVTGVSSVKAPESPVNGGIG